MKRLCAIAFSALTGASLCAGGFGVGVQTAFDIGEKGAIVPKLEYLRLTDSSTEEIPFQSINLSATVNCFTLGADYDYYFGEQAGKGFYALGGLGVAFANFNVSGSTYGASTSTSSNQTVLYPEAGVGYSFNRYLGVELLYKDLNFKDVNFAVSGYPVTYSFSGSVEASLVVRF